MLYENDIEDIQLPTYITESKFIAGLSFSFIIILFMWILFGIIAFIMSLVCFGRSGTLLEKFIGLLLAIFYGPFYFLFYIFNSSYCR
jgi:hypothetical protein